MVDQEERLLTEIIIAVMPKKPLTLYPSSSREMSALGERPRLRRRFSVETVCIRADISRPTRYKIEHGDPSVSIGHYVQVLRVLGLVEELACIVKEDRIGRRIQDESLPHRKRAPRTKRSTGYPDADI